MSNHKERQVVTDIIKLYKESQCLWDISSSAYKDTKMKKKAWELLLEKYKEYDRNANDATIKKKIENLKTSYRREVRKVMESKLRTGSSARYTSFHRPNLWYFKLMTFLDKKNVSNRTGVDSIMSEKQDESQIREPKIDKITKEHNIIMDKKQEKILDTAQEPVRIDINPTQTPNPFGVYVGKKIEEITQGQQRDLAEKLISDILFFAKTNNLTFDTKIDIPSRTHQNSSHHYDQCSPCFKQSPPSTHISQSSHASSDVSSNSPSHQYNISIHSPPVSSHTPFEISVPTTSPNLHYSIAMESHDSSSNLHQMSSSSSTHPPHSSTSYSHDPLQVISPASPVVENAVLYAEGPTAETLKELLISKHK